MVNNLMSGLDHYSASIIALKLIIIIYKHSYVRLTYLLVFGIPHANSIKKFKTAL